MSSKSMPVAPSAGAAGSLPIADVGKGGNAVAAKVMMRNVCHVCTILMRFHHVFASALSLSAVYADSGLMLELEIA